MADRNSIIEKIKALLSKTRDNGCTEAEEMSAIAKARAMMDTHVITNSELALSREEKALLFAEGPADAHDPREIKWMLTHAVSKFCCVTIFKTGRRKNTPLSFVGLKSDVALATWLLDHLSDFVHEALFEFLLDCHAPDGKERNDEIRGFVMGITERISERMVAMCTKSEKEAVANSKALIIVKDQAIQAYLEEHKIKLGTTCCGGGSMSGSARAAGASAGDRASFGRPVSGGAAVLRIGVMQ